jgi:hypothetical protein
MDLRELKTYPKKQLAVLCEQMAKDITLKDKRIRDLERLLKAPQLKLKRFLSKWLN